VPCIFLGYKKEYMELNAMPMTGRRKKKKKFFFT
jgi:hypothetical protein